MEELAQRPRVRKGKNKKSFLSKAKFFGKSGKFGQGSHLDEDTFQYFCRVLDLLKEDKFDTEEEKAIFINNAIDATVDNEINYSCNQFTSAVLEKLLVKADDEVIKRYLTAFYNELRPICSDPYASHVLQRLLLIMSERVKVPDVKSEVKEEADISSTFEKWILKIGKFMLNNLEDFVWDTYANHVIRTLVECLGGIASVESSTSCKKQSHSQRQAKLKIPTQSRKIPESYSTVLKDFICRLSAWPQFPDLAYDNLSSGLLQSLLFSIKAVDSELTNKLISQLLNDCFTCDRKVKTEKGSGKKNKTDDPEILPIPENESATRLLEVALTVASQESFTQIYTRCFINQLGLLSKNFGSNFAVQRLLDNCSQEEEFEQIYTEMEPHVEDILAHGYTGVIFSLAEGCKRHATKQNSFQKCLMKALHCLEPNERQSQVALLTLSLKTHEQQEGSDKFHVHLHGSLILQTMLNFNKPIKVVNSLLEMRPSDITTVFTDPKGSHVMNAFMESTSVGEKSRNKMIKKLQGMYVTLVCSKHGSRVVDAVWEASTLKNKFIIMDELAAKEPILCSDKYGSILAYKYNLSLYKHNKDNWKNAQGKENRKRKLFADIIGNAKK